MANLDAPFSRITDANGRSTAGSRTIYDEGTSNLSAIWSDKAMTVALANPVPADAGGALPPIYIGAGAYKIIDKDVAGVTLQENDHYVVPNLSGLNTINFPVVGKNADFTVTAADYGKIFEVDASGGPVTVTMDSAVIGNGMPFFVTKKDSSANNVINSAGIGQTFNGGSSTYNLTQQNQTAGFASEGAAGWRIWLLPAPTATPIRPQGRLTLTTGLPVLAADVLAATTLFYTAFEGNYVPIWDGATWQTRQFAADLSLALDSNAVHTNYHQALKAFDVFLANDNGTLRMVTGPAWTTAGNYVSAGVLTTGVAARAAAISRVNGIYVNTAIMTGRFGNASGNTISVPAGQGTYLGTIWIDATDGQLSCHVSYGQNRKYGVWNAYNRQPIVLQAGDTGAGWAAYNTATIRAANGTAANGLTVLCGLAEEAVVAAYSSQVLVGGSNRIPVIGVGYNSTTAISGRKSQIGVAAAFLVDQHASFEAAPFLGLGAFISLQAGDGSASTTWTNGSGFDELRAVWRG